MKKVLSMALAVMMILSVLPLSALAAVDYDETASDGYYNVISKNDYELAPGITESEIILNNDAGSHRQVAHVVEIDINNPYTKVIPSYKGMAEGLEAKDYGVQVMSKQAAYAEANGYGNVVAAMNLSLSWYDSAYYKEHPELVGEPLGYMILDGVQYTNSNGQTSGAQTCLVINFDEKDGVARPADIPKTEIRSTSSAITGWEEQVIPANFGFLVKDGVNQYGVDNNASNGASRSFVGIKADGSIVMVMNDGRQSPYSAGFTNYEMAEFMLSLGCVQAVNGDGGGSSAFLSQRPGEELKINCSPSDGAERETTHGILVISTAPATGEFVRSSISSDEDYYTPGSSVQFSAIGSDLVGTAAEIPADAVWQLADSSVGTIDQNGLFVSNGTVGDVTVQMVRGGEVVGEDTIHMVMPDTLMFAQANMVVPYGKTVDLALSATYDNKSVVLKASDVTFTLSAGGIGTISGFDFTAAQEGAASTAAVLTAVVGDVSATTNLSLGKGSEIVFNFEDQDLTGWSIFTNYGKYGPVGPNGKVTDENGNYWYHGQNERGNISIVDASSGKVKNGQYALAVECDFTQIFETGYHALNLIFPTIDCTDTVAIGFWMYIPYDARHVQLGIGAGGFDNGELFELCEGWHYVAAQAKNNQFNFVNFSVDDRACASSGNYYDYITEANLNGKYTFYIDDITLDYSTAVDDRETPIFSDPLVQSVTGETSAALSGQTINYSTATFEVSVAENMTKSNAVGLDATSAKAYIDGQEVSCIYKNGKITIAGAVLVDGFHTVKFSIADKMGNESWVDGDIVVETGSDDSTIKVVPQNPEADRILIGSLYWMDVVATDIETVDKVELTFDMNNASSWELEGMTVAEGFTATYSIQEDDNIATIIIERTSKNTTAGEAVLASFPVRTWVSTTNQYEGYEEKDPTWLVNYGCIWKKSIEMELQRGIVTFVDDSVSTFGMEDLLVETEVFFTNYVRKSVEGAQAQKDAWIAAGTGWHEHTTEDMADQAATCTTAGYTGRTFCSVCNSVVEWGTTVPATGHDYQVVDGALKCVNSCRDLFSGELDGKTYIDGVVVEGWVSDTYYYVDGVMVTGQYYMDGALYTFGEDGIYNPDYKYTGFYETADGKMMYFVGNVPTVGYLKVAGEPYYFDESGYGFEGEYTLCGETCIFENGQYVSCSTASLSDAGMMGANVAYIIYADGAMVLDGAGEIYSFKNHGTRPFDSYSIKSIHFGSAITRIGTYAFAYSSVSAVTFAEGSQLKQIGTCAFYEDYALKTVELPDSVDYISNTAFGNCVNLNRVVLPKNVSAINNAAFKNSPYVTLYVAQDSYAMQYAIDRQIAYVTYTPETRREIRDVDGTLFYFEDGVIVYAGLIQLDSCYYYVRSNGQVAANITYWVSKTNGLLPAGNYTFGADGKMTDAPGTEPDAPDTPNVVKEIREENGELYYYENGAKTYGGLILLDGSYYYARSSGKVVVNATYWITKNNDLLPVGNYTFGADGKMTDASGTEPDTPDTPDVVKEIREENGELYYYENGVKTYGGLILLDGSYYYARSSGKLAVNTAYWITKNNDLLPVGNYTFGADGKMTDAPGTEPDTPDTPDVVKEIREENGELYYYENGVKTYGGLILLDESYYYVRSSGKVVVNTTYWITKNNDLLPVGNYAFGADGKMIMG